MRTFQPQPIQYKFLSSATAGVFSGYAATYGGAPDRHGDVILPGAFTKSLARHTSEGTRPALLWQHDQTAPIGVWEHFDDSPEGLRANGRLTLDVPQAKSAHALMRDDALALSIGFRVPAGGMKQGDHGGSLLTEIDLLEISVVALPANASARITSVKCFDATDPNPREFERAARDALGLSAREAKRLMSGGWNGLVRDERPDDSDQLAAIAAKLQNITKALKGAR